MPEKLCKKSGVDPAAAACADTCAPACAATAAPTPNLDEFGDDILESETCADDSEWYLKKANKNCKWVFASVLSSQIFVTALVGVEEPQSLQ